MPITSHGESSNPGDTAKTKGSRFLLEPFVLKGGDEKGGADAESADEAASRGRGNF